MGSEWNYVLKLIKVRVYVYHESLEIYVILFWNKFVVVKDEL